MNRCKVFTSIVGFCYFTFLIIACSPSPASLNSTATAVAIASSSTRTANAPTPTPSTTVTPTQGPIPTTNLHSAVLALPDFSKAESITITDNWVGLSNVAPISSWYLLEKPYESSPDHFEGAAFFRAGGTFGEKRQSAKIITVPNEAIQSFLKKLAEVKPEPGLYNPQLHTDDYPQIIIDLVYGRANLIEFSTYAQGEEHSPWTVTYSNQTYIVNSGVPMQALEILNPYLSKDVLQNLIEQEN